MSDKLIVGMDRVQGRVYDLALTIASRMRGHERCGIYGVPRGGVTVAALLAGAVEQVDSDLTVLLLESPDNADFIVDDLVDSGTTKQRYKSKFPNATFLTLYNKQIEGQLCKGRAVADYWLIFPWEERDDTATEDDIFLRLLQFIGEDPARDGLKDTPKRMQKAWAAWTEGYNTDFKELFTTFENDNHYDQMVTVRNIPFYSHCEHHLAPFFGTADISYIPKGHVVGLSKLSRVLNGYAKRLQVQERLTQQVADCIMEHLEPVGAGVIVRARHLCMESRGIAQQGHHTVTTALKGVYLEPEVRQEFLKV